MGLLVGSCIVRSAKDSAHRGDLDDESAHFAELIQNRNAKTDCERDSSGRGHARPATTVVKVDRWARWREIVTRPEEDIPLDEAAFLIGAMADDTVDVSAELARLDELAGRIGPADTGEVCRLVFETLGVRGDRETYDDPRNSYLDQVLDRRLGIPIFAFGPPHGGGAALRRTARRRGDAGAFPGAGPQ